MTSQDYHITSVKDTDFDPDQYGNRFYSIEVEEQKGSLLWKAKARPEPGKVVYGHTEMSKSGKSMLFKKDQKPDDYQPGAPRTAAPTHISESLPILEKPAQTLENAIRWDLCVKEANSYITKNRPDLDPNKWATEVNEYANALFFLTSEPVKEEKKGDYVPTDIDENPIDISEIPF